MAMSEPTLPQLNFWLSQVQEGCNTSRRVFCKDDIWLVCVASASPMLDRQLAIRYCIIFRYFGVSV